MLCKEYSYIFGASTRAIQIINILLMFSWGINLIVINYYPSIYRIEPFVNLENTLTVFNLLALGSSILGLVTKGERAVGFISLGLLSSSIFHILTAYTYINNYPPLRIGLTLTVLWSIIFFVSGVYALTCENKNKELTKQVG